VGTFSLSCELDGLKNELEVWDCNSIAWDLGVYTLALARRRLGIPIGSDAAAERWSVSSVDVSLTAACPLLPLALWALAGSHSPFCCELHFPFAHNEQSFAVPTVGPHSGRKGGAAVWPPLEVDGFRGGVDKGTLTVNCWIFAVFNGGGGNWAV
jgi:hypothetical protein